MPDNSSPNPAWKNQGAGPGKKDAAAAPGWKKDGGTTGREPAGGGPRPWQGQPATPAGPPRPTSRTTKLVAALGLLGAIVGAAVLVVILWRPLKPASLVLLGSSYDVNLALPHNVYGWQNLQAFKDFADRSHVHLANPPGASQEVHDQKSWDKLWDGIPSFDEKTAIIYLSLHGGADAGGAYLFLGDARARDKIYLKKIIDELPQHKELRNKNVILVLEPAQLAAHWPSGMLQNHFVRELRKLTEVIENNPKLLVVCASDVGQVSWPSEEWRQTIFGHYLLEGLHGAANGGEAESRITAGELFDYVQRKVSAWAQTNRGTAQTPIFLGNKAARNIELVQIKEPYTEKRPDEAPGRSTELSRALKAAWESCEKLAKETPAPAVYTPHLWRQYRDTLLRWEQLERAGDLAKVSALESQCTRWRDQINEQKKARADLTTWEITRALPLPQLLGLTAADAETGALSYDGLISEAWAPLWRAKTEDEQRDVVMALRKKAGAGDILGSEQGMLLYAQLCRHLFATTTADDLKKPSGLKTRAAFLEKTFNQKRPAEMNYLVTLLNDLDPGPRAMPPPKDLKTALEVRLLAEEAALAAPASQSSRHPYSETVANWIRPKIAEADKQRRLGEDYLFGKDKEWTLARDLFAKARSNYDEALKDAEVIREALDLRDRVLADLPYYAEWLARRPLPPGDLLAENLEKLVKQVERLSFNVGQLTWGLKTFEGQDIRTLKAKDRNPERLSAKELLDKWIHDIKEDFQDEQRGLEHQFKLICQKLQSVVHQPLFWQDLEAALAVPLIGADLRKDLVAKSRGLSRKLLEDKETALEESKAEHVAEKELRNRRLALAVLVPQWQDNHPVNIAIAKDKSLAQDTLAKAIASYWQELPGKIAEKYAASCQNTDLKEAAEQLSETDILCRLLPGGFVPSWNEVPYGPPQGLRNLRLHDLLLHQAKRTKEDYWFSESRLPYYVPAAKAYAHMAKDLAVAGNNEVINTARQKTASDFDESVQRIDLKVQGPAETPWTSELQLPLTWRMDAAKTVPPGVPMVRLQMTGPLTAAQESSIFERKAAASWPPQATYYLKKPNEQDQAAAEQADSEVTFVCLYRGQEVKGPITTKLARTRTIVRHLPPEKAGLAFRLGKGFDYGAISFVLDCSGSMVNNRLNGITRFEHAIRALDATLKAIPNDTWVSLLVFVNDVAGGDPKFRLLQEPERWKEEDRDALIRKVRRLQFKDGASPIAKALVISRDKGFPDKSRFNGPKLIVALTDGDDTYSFPPEYADPDTYTPAKHKAYNARVAKYMKSEFDGRGVEVHVICFNKEDDPESNRAKEQFKSAVEELDPQGSFTIQPNPNKLAADLELAIRPKLYLYDGAQPVRGLYGQPISPFEREYKFYGLKQGDYTAWVQKSKSFDIGKTHIGLELGDFMMLTLKREGRAMYFERGLFAREEKGKMIASKSFRDDAGKSHLIAVLRNEINTKNNEVNQLITVEEEPTGQKGERLVQHPAAGFVWLELKIKAAAGPKLVTWQRDYQYPAPALSVNVQDWPLVDGKEAHGETSLWWATNAFLSDPAYAAIVTRKLGTKGGPDKAPSPQTDWIGSSQVRIEQPVMETQLVTTAFGKKSTRCLVVRVSHEPDKPVFVQLQAGAQARIGQEHRYYADVNRYTAFFWDLPSDPDQVTLHVIALDEFKRASTAAGRSARFESLIPTTQAGPQRVSLVGPP